VVAVGSFAATPDVLVLLAAAGLIFLAIMLPLAGEFGRLSAASAPAVVPPAARASARPAKPTGLE
jgi:hypothetical protein